MLETKLVHYVRRGDDSAKRYIESIVEYPNGKPMKYKITGFTRLRGIEYDIYELVPVRSHWWCCIERNRIHQKG